MREATGAITVTVAKLGLEIGKLRQAISKEYEEVANNPQRRFHFHTGNPAL